MLIYYLRVIVMLGLATLVVLAVYVLTFYWPLVLAFAIGALTATVVRRKRSQRK